MKSDFDFIKEILGLLSIPLTPWVIVAILIAIILRNRLAALWGSLLDRIGAVTRGEWSYWRFDPRYRAVLRDEHHLLKLVGLRIEHERRPHISDAYVPIKLTREGANLDTAEPLEDVIRERPYCVVLGDPGAGKSTILDHLIVAATVPVRSGVLDTLWRYCLPFRVAQPNLLPIYVPLRRCKESNPTLLADILDPETRILSAAAMHRMPPDFIERALKKGRGLLLLDGLDEVKDLDAHKSVATKINDLRRIYPLARIIVTCRRAGWQGLLQGGFETLTALGLDAKQQYDFVHRWYRAIYRYKAFDRPLSDDERNRRASKEADSLLGLLRNKERLREIAGNPLLLSLISLVYSRTKSLPRGRTGLYQECIVILLDHWDQIDKDFDFDDEFPTREQKKLLLRRVAHRMQERGIKEIDRTALEGLVREFLPMAGDRAPDIVRKIEVRSGLMTERSIDVLAFSHLTLQEYLIVEYLLEEPGAELDLASIKDWTPWREPFLLYCGVKTRAHLLVKEVYDLQPLIALDAIPELLPTLLPNVSHIVQRALDDVTFGRLDFTAAVPSLVGLLSLEGGIFSDAVLKFMSNQVPAGMADRRTIVIESVSRIPTREAARIILWLSKGQPLESASTAALARIGDPALYECLEAADRSEISDRELLAIFDACATVTATQMLLRRYKFDPPAGLELEWAIAWARRLSPEDDQVLENVVSVPSLPVNAHAWPYGSSLKTAPILMSRVVDILQDRYRSLEEIGENAATFRQLIGRVQLPILVRARPFTPLRRTLSLASYVFPGFSFEQRLLHYRLFRGGITDRWARYGLAFDYDSLGLLNEHSWRTLGGFLRQASGGRRRMRQVWPWVGLSLLGLVLFVSVASLLAVLPPDGTFIGFLRTVPWWGYAVPALIVTSPIGFYLVALIRKESPDSALVTVVPLVIAVMLATLLIVPSLYLMWIVIAASIVPVERSMSERRIPWGVASLVTAASIAVGSFCSIAARDWISPWIALVAFSIGTAAGIALMVWALAFRQNGVVMFIAANDFGVDVLQSFPGVNPGKVLKDLPFRGLHTRLPLDPKALDQGIATVSPAAR